MAQLCDERDPRRRRLNEAIRIWEERLRGQDRRLIRRIIEQGYRSGQNENRCCSVMFYGLYWARLQQGAGILAIHIATRGVSLRRMHRAHDSIAAIEC